MEVIVGDPSPPPNILNLIILNLNSVLNLEGLFHCNFSLKLYVVLFHPEITLYISFRSILSLKTILGS